MAKNATESIDGCRDIDTEVLIVGSGMLGATFARKLTEGGMQVFMIDAGAQLSPEPGWHLKNSFLYQRDIDLFPGVIQGQMSLFSVPPDRRANPTLDPDAFTYDHEKYKKFVKKGHNPLQSPYDNLPAAYATYAVGGMGTHWTNCTPREHPDLERSRLIPDREWRELYHESETLLKTTQHMFDKSIRNTVVKETLCAAYRKLLGRYAPQSLPLAGERRQDAPEFITWTGSNTILGKKLVDQIMSMKKKPIQLKPMWQCIRLVRSMDGKKIDLAIVKDLLNDQIYKIHAKVFVLAAGAILTPQILFNSDIRPRALGHYLCAQTMTFCQIVLKQEIVDKIPCDPRWEAEVRKYQEEHPNDPIPIPMSDPTPQCWIPVSEHHPWHCQVHVDAFSYGETQPNVDPRLIVQLRSFGRVIPKPSFEKCVEFSKDNLDTFSMPQPTFHYSLNKEEKDDAHAMMKDMCHAANALGGYLPGSEPAFLDPGSALHITGTCRMGESDNGESVVDINSQVWNIANLFIGSCAVIPTGTACNPTNTAIALAVKSCREILARNKRGQFK